MGGDLAVVAMLLSAGVNILALVTPIVMIRSEINLLRYQVSELKKDVERLSRRIFTGLDDREVKG